MVKEKNMGLMGGTFDPVHLGHLAIAEEARKRLKLSVVLFVPAGQPWLKSNRAITPAEHRLEMLRLVIADKHYFRVSTMEIERLGASYSVDTVRELKAQLGRVGELYFILGWDSLLQLPQWREPARLIQMCYLVVAPRPGYSAPDLKSLEALVPGISDRVIFLDEPNLDFSATEIRRRVAGGLPISQLVPAPVEKYIREHGLYLKLEGES